MSEEEEDDVNGQENDNRAYMNTIIRSLINDMVYKRKIFDDLVDPNNGNIDFKKAVTRHMASLKVLAKSVSVPTDYVKVDIYDNAELGQIAVMNGLLVFVTEEIKGDTKIVKMHAIDHEKKILYTNTSAKHE